LSSLLVALFQQQRSSQLIHSLLRCTAVVVVLQVAAQEAGAAKSDKAEHAAVSKMTGVGGEEIALEHW
jgi:hypothetical protein